MSDIPDEWMPTRRSLLIRLRNLGDQASWQEFFDTYWKLVYGTAIKAGLRDAEAQDVVQEVMASTVRSLPNFKYDPAIGSFKAWLLTLTRWRIADQFRKRERAGEQAAPRDEATTRTAVIEEIADPASLDLDAFWNTQWERQLLEKAIDNVRRKHDQKRYQIFDLYVTKEMPAENVATLFNVDVSQVYLAKHRITELIREEIRRLEKEMI